MTNLWKGLIGSGLVITAIVMYFALSDKEEIKHEVRIDKLEIKQDGKQFDDEFVDFDGKPSAKALAQRKVDNAAIQSKINREQAKLDGLDGFDDDFIKGGQQALRDEDARLRGSGKHSAAASSVSAVEAK